MVAFAVVIYILERLATLVSAVARSLAGLALWAGEAYAKVTLFAMRRFLEWLADKLPYVEFLDDWYRRALVGAIAMAAAYWIGARLIGLPTPLLLMAALLLHGGVWGALADEKHSTLEWGSHDDDFPLRF